MSRLPVGAALMEARGLVRVLREELGPVDVGPILVSGMLSEQLARQLGQGAAPGAVVTGNASRLAGAAAVVHVIAGEPSAADEALVEEADRRGVPVVLVQLWPQEEWTKPYVLSPFVVECRAGEGFPVSEIARRLVEAVENPVALARRVPVLQDPVADAVVATTAVRAAVLGALGRGDRGTRPLIALEQIRMLAELRATKEESTGKEDLPLLGGLAAATIGIGFLFREAARTAGRALPPTVVNAAVAAAGTWALGEGLRRLEQRLG